VFGCGLIGGSIVLKLRQAGADVAGWDPDPKTRELARSVGLTIFDNIEAAANERDLIFLAAPLPRLPKLLDDIRPLVTSQCIVTDVGSAKSPIMLAASRNAGPAMKFLGGHPMAGTQESGFMGAREDLFDNAAWALCLESTGDLDRFHMVCATLVGFLGVRVVPLTAHVHDQVIAACSHLPHILAGALACSTADSELRAIELALSSTSFKLGTSVAGSPPKRTTDILWPNKEVLIEKVLQLRLVLDRYESALRGASDEGLLRLFTKAGDVRAELISREISREERSFDLTTEEAGELSFLLNLGLRGGHVSSCATSDRSVTYETWSPVVQRARDAEPN